jgi:hypothetical protein
MSIYARAKKGLNTLYMQFRTPHSARLGSENSAGVTDADTGQSPIARWLSYALNYSDAVSVPTVGMVFDCPIPAGSLVELARVRMDVPFTGTVGTGLDDVNIGDSNDEDGWADGLDFTAALATAGVPVYYQDVSAAYMAYVDITQGSAGPQFYFNGGTVRVIVASTDDLLTGNAVLQLLTNSYCEPLGAEA